MQKKFIIYIILIVVILVLVFLSQQSYFKNMGKNLVSAATDRAKSYLTKGSAVVTSDIYPKISTEVEKRGEDIKNSVDQAKQNVTESIGKKIENYFSGIKNAVAGKANDNCPVQTPTN